MKLIDELRRYLSGRHSSYRATFRGPLAQNVLSDLAVFCRAHESTFHVDPRIAANLDGRREVYLRIVNHLQLSPEELFKLATGTAGQAEIPMIDPEEYHRD